MPTTEFQSITNLLKRAIDDIKRESKSVEASKLAVLIAFVGLIVTSLISMSAWRDAIEANIRTEKIGELKDEMNGRYDQLVDSHEVTQIYVRDLKAFLIEKGFEPPEEEE